MHTRAEGLEACLDPRTLRPTAQSKKSNQLLFCPLSLFFFTQPDFSRMVPPCEPGPAQGFLFLKGSFLLPLCPPGGSGPGFLPLFNTLTQFLSYKWNAWTDLNRQSEGGKKTRLWECLPTAAGGQKHEDGQPAISRSRIRPCHMWRLRDEAGRRQLAVKSHSCHSTATQRTRRWTRQRE